LPCYTRWLQESAPAVRERL